VPPAVAAQVSRDPKDPGGEFPARLELLPCLMHPHEGVMSQVFGQSRVSGKSMQETEHPLAELLIERGPVRSRFLTASVCHHPVMTDATPQSVACHGENFPRRSFQVDLAAALLMRARRRPSIPGRRCLAL
jgi:hypothetical protein